MLAQFDRLLIAIRREMAHRQHAHGKLLSAIYLRVTAGDSER
jgi:hypothetical protein